MGIDAVALVRIPAAALESSGLSPSRLNGLIDGTLVYTAARFGSRPDELGLALRHLLGDALDLHDDPRGILMIPDVAEVHGTRYDDVVAEVGEAGHWAPLLDADAVPDRYADASPGSLEQLIGAAMTAMGGELRTEIQQAMASGDPERMAGIEQKMAAAFGGEEAMAALARRLQDALGRAEASGGGSPGGDGVGGDGPGDDGEDAEAPGDGKRS